MQRNTSPQINIIVPLYNEEAVFESLVDRLINVMNSTKLKVSVIMIDDGSSDGTPYLMEKLSKQDYRFNSIFLSRNFGHQIALTAGLSYVNASDAAFIIDGDLQDPPELLDEFYSKLIKGYDIVYAIRTKRKESFFKRVAYKTFYRILKRVSNIEIPLDSGDFSMISRKVVDNLNQMQEESRFIRGMRSWIGYKQKGVIYERENRKAGKSKYSLKTLTLLALNGIFNFSEYPIRFITSIGILAILISFIYLGIAIAEKIFFNSIIEGFTGLVFIVALFGGVQLVSIGILGEYIVRIFFQTKQRPLFIVKKQIVHGETIL